MLLRQLRLLLTLPVFVTSINKNTMCKINYSIPTPLTALETGNSERHPHTFLSFETTDLLLRLPTGSKRPSRPTIKTLIARCHPRSHFVPGAICPRRLCRTAAQPKRSNSMSSCHWRGPTYPTAICKEWLVPLQPCKLPHES